MPMRRIPRPLKR